MRKQRSNGGNNPSTDNAAIKIRLGIKSKLILAFLIPVAFLILLGIISYSQTAAGIRDLYQTSSMQILGKSADYLEVVMLDVETTAYDISTDPDLVDYFSGSGETGYDTVKHKLKTLLATDAYVENGYFIASEGTEHLSTNPEINFEADACERFTRSQDYVQVTSRNRKVWLGGSEFIDSYKPAGNISCGNRRLTLIRRVDNILTGQDIGFLILEMRESVMEKLLDDVRLGDNSVVVLAAQDEKEIAKAECYAAAGGESIITSDAVFLDIQQSTKKSGGYDLSRPSGRYWLCYYYIGDLGSCIIGIIPEETMLKQANDIRGSTILIVIIVTVVVFLTGTLLAAGMSSSIKRIIRGAGEAAKGDLTVEIVPKGQDELAVLSHSINHMLAAVKNLITRVSEESCCVEQAAGLVGETNQSVYQAAVKLGSSIEQIRTGTQKQEQSADNCLANMGQLSVKIEMVAGNTAEIEQISEETKELVDAGIHIMDHLSDVSGETTGNLKQIMDDNRILGEQIKNISRIAEVITDIADQTTLLSFNASIEAAKAGNAGRGFSVVASEIKKLAEQTMSFTEQIKGIIDEVQRQSEKTTAHTNIAGRLVESQENAVLEAVGAFHDIDAHVEKLNEDILAIMEQTRAIEYAGDVTMAAAADISEVVQENAAAAAVMNRSIREQKEKAEKMTQYAGRLDEVSCNLKDAVDIFKIT